MKDFYSNVVISCYELFYNIRALGKIIVRQWHLLSPFQLVGHHIICQTNSLCSGVARHRAVGVATLSGAHKRLILGTVLDQKTVIDQSAIIVQRTRH